MKNFGHPILLLVSILFLFLPAAPVQAAQADFAVWLDQLREDARAAGISQRTLDTALADVAEPMPRVIELDRNQPEQRESLEDYVAIRAGKERVAEGRQMLKRYPTWLDRVERQYRVQRRFLVALWGIESRYGRHTGQIPVVSALVTLAYDERRGAYFRKELLEALRILDEGHVFPTRMLGSWAGAMGPFQFMPSSFRHYAVDATGEGRIDIWGTLPDALASAANYLAKGGWQYDQTWGRPVRLPKSLDQSLAGLDTRLPLARWQALGVRRIDGRALPGRNLEASLIQPDGPDGPAFLVYNNYRVLLRWNRSHSFAVAVGTLADRLAAKP